MGICSSDQSKKRVSAANEIELDKKADMFWSDQVDGNPSSWAAIKAYFEMVKKPFVVYHFAFPFNICNIYLYVFDYSYTFFVSLLYVSNY